MTNTRKLIWEIAVKPTAVTQIILVCKEVQVSMYTDSYFFVYTI